MTKTLVTIYLLVVMLLAAAIAGGELRDLHLENEQLKAECALKTQALTYANVRIMELEAKK